jgi:hypothetical protein
VHLFLPGCRTMRRSTMKLLLLLLAMPPSLLPADKPDLAGRWELNFPLSKLGKMPKPVRMELTVTREDNTYHAIQHTVDGTNGEADVAGDWYLDGKEHRIAETNMVQTSRWDGQKLIADKKSSDGVLSEHIEITLSSDGSRATEKISSTGPGGIDTRVLVWNRKN